jgi:glucosamine-6-phosphate deaminase
MNKINLQELYTWCSIPAEQLVNHSRLKIPFRLTANSEEMGELIARDFADEIISAGNNLFRAIVPCGPKCWYAPFTRIINDEKISLKNVTIFHMDECLNWEGKLLPVNHPYNFRTFMEKYFYDGIDPKLAVPVEKRYFPEPSSIELIKQKISEAPIDITLGGWGQDGHVAYNQSRRHPFNEITIEQLRNSELRIQEK